MPTRPELDALRRKLEEEEQAYAARLGRLDALARMPAPFEGEGELARRDSTRPGSAPPSADGLVGGRCAGAMAPVVERQVAFNSALVQLLNGHLEETARLRAHLRAGGVHLIQYLQRVLPTMDARDRVSAALATTRAELILEAFDRRQQSRGAAARGADGAARTAWTRWRRRCGRCAARRRTAARRAAGGARRRAAAHPRPADAAYVAFENASAAPGRDPRPPARLPAASSPAWARWWTSAAGAASSWSCCARRRLEARGVEGNAAGGGGLPRAAGSPSTHGDLLAFLRALPAASVGGVFAAQVAEHLPPAVLQAMLAESHRALRPGGRLVLETVNPRLRGGLLRRLHPRPHPRAAAAPRHPALPRRRQRVHRRARRAARRRWTLRRGCADPGSRACPAPAVDALNENVARLNDVLFAPQEYALIATR